MIIFDEKLYAEEMLKKGFKTTHKHVNELGILAKYYFSQGKEKDEVKENIKIFCEKHIKEFNNDEWYKIINRTVNVAKNKKLITGKVVYITEDELNTIKQLDKLNEQKVAFVLLVVYKFYDQRKFEITIEDLYRLCKIDSLINSQTKLKILQNLTKQGLININMKGERWVEFISKGNDVLYIKDFDDFIYEYLRVIGDVNVTTCQNCSKAIQKKSNRTKYCRRCNADVRTIQNRDNFKAWYSKNKTSNQLED